MTDTINVKVGEDVINVKVGEDVINVKVESLNSFQAYVTAGSKFYLDGPGGSTYLKYNSTTEMLELWVKGVKQKDWGSYEGGNPFA